MNTPDHYSVPVHRRKFLRQLISTSLASVAFPALGHAGSAEGIAPLPDYYEDERYWEKIKTQFSVKPGLIMVNAANLCPAPLSVQRIVREEMELLQSDLSFQFRNRYTENRDQAITKLERYLNAGAGQIGITRNTSESNCVVAMGLRLNAGDEILLWDQNHPSNMDSWKHRAQLSGIKINLFSLSDKTDTASILGTVGRAITPKTRVLAFSHISNTSGIAMPATELCQMAREKNIFTLVDGAQSFGYDALDLPGMGCDSFSASTHKWFMGPHENGILYVRGDSFSKIEPRVISAGWKNTAATVQDKFCSLGQRNDPTLAGIPVTVDFHTSIGPSVIKSRVDQLCNRLKQQIIKRLPSASLVTPLVPEQSGGVVVVRFEGKDPNKLYEQLYQEHNIAGAPAGGVRFSPHIYNTLADMDSIVDVLSKIGA